MPLGFSRLPQVIGLSFHNRPNVPTPRVNVAVKGHPTGALERAREICDLILSDHGPWKIASIDYEGPPDTKPESEGIITVTARVKDSDGTGI